ncbi:MAG TPA: rhodanese-like domain-containing protein [Solirubrobacteraceae bacterium]|nr:rhodanese-like domain-containing protein [Solirubrobacteraceae bacterium]
MSTRFRRCRTARHLPGALNLVEEDTDEHILGALPDKAAAIVTYSTDADCTRGPDLAARLQGLGYTDVRTYREGVEDWVGAGLPVDRPRGVTLNLPSWRWARPRRSSRAIRGPASTSRCS